jgi:hypothetical protein
MAGLLTHLFVSVLGGLVIIYFSKKWFYGAVFAIGQLMPDILDFGVVGIKLLSVDPSLIVRDSWFAPLRVFGHNIFNWFAICAILFIIVFLVFHLIKVKIPKKYFYSSILIFFISVSVHLVLDIFIQERSPWI